MDCKSCGDTNQKGSKFCKTCGYLLGFSCPECKKEINPDSKFCILCGASISREELDSTSQVEPSESVTQHSTTSDVSGPKKSYWSLFGKIMLGFLVVFVVLLVIGIIAGEEESANHVEELSTQKLYRQYNPIDEDTDAYQGSSAPTPDPTPEGLNYFAQGEQYLWHDQDYVKAAKSFTEYINLNQNTAKLFMGYQRLGDSYHHLAEHLGHDKRIDSNIILGHFQQALQNYDKAIELNPENPDVYGQRGHVHRKLGQYQNAIKDYDKHIELDPSHPWPHHYKGMTYRDIGQFEVAIQNWERYIELRLIESADWIESEQSANAYTNIGLAYVELGQNQKAIEHFDKALTINPNYLGAIRGKGKAAANLN